METPKLSVEAIEKGTVIDHIPAGKGLIILRQFKLLHYGSAVTVGFNRPRKPNGSKPSSKIPAGCRPAPAPTPPTPPPRPPDTGPEIA